MIIDNSINKKKESQTKYVIAVDRDDLFFKGFKTDKILEEYLICTENINEAKVFEVGGFYDYSQTKKLIKVVESLGHKCEVAFVANTITVISK